MTIPLFSKDADPAHIAMAFDEAGCVVVTDVLDTNDRPAQGNRSHHRPFYNYSLIQNARVAI